jgi:anti-anti-sigma regulatory factor
MATIKRFFYVATIKSTNKPEIELSGCIDTSSAIDVQRLINNLVIQCQDNGYQGVVIHISQLNFLMDIPYGDIDNN